MHPNPHVTLFQREADDLLAVVEEVALELDPAAPAEESLHRLFRAFHTLKGSGGMFGFEAVAAFTHHIEGALDEVRAGRLAVSAELIEQILAAKDELTRLVGAGPAGGAPSERVQTIVAALARLRGAASAGGGSVDALTESGAATPRIQNFHIRFRPDPRLLTMGTDPQRLLADLRALGPCVVRACVAEVPPLDALQPDLCYLHWEIELSTDRGRDAVQDVFIFVQDGAELAIEERAESPAASAAATEPGSGGSAVANAPVAARGSVAGADSLVRVPSQRLDRLVNLVGELVMNQSRLLQAAARFDAPELMLPVEEIERLIGELRDTVLGIRMMPIGTTFGRFKRLVHDLSAELGKEVDLVTEGAETELDKTVLDQLVDPLVHLIRNSLDHGIELPETRVQAGKPRRGRIRLTGEHTGSNVVITIADDGQGLDPEAIRRKGIERGLLAADAQPPEAELFELIFQPGFSTAAAVTNVSGRGVGMDVVRRQLEMLRGSIQLQSERGRGTTLRLTLPLTLAIIDGLLIEVADEHYIVPMSAVLENVELTRAERLRNNGRNLIAVRGELVPYLSLRDTFEVDGEMPPVAKVVVLRHGVERVGLLVDRVVGSRQTVIQPLGRFFRHVPLFSGATILGDGRAALILEVGGLLRAAALAAVTAPSSAAALSA